VVRLDRRYRRCDYGFGGGDRRLHGELVGFSLTLLFPEGRRDGNGNQTEAAAVHDRPLSRRDRNRDSDRYEPTREAAMAAFAKSWRRS
jgi:hypothetical protein